MLTLEQKIELANWIVEHNNYVALTGSLYIYLKCQQLNIPYPFDREPQDIDILVDNRILEEEDFYDNICLPPLMEDIVPNNEISDYPVIGRFMYQGTKVEFLYTDNYRDEFTETRHLILTKNGKPWRTIYHWNFGLMFDLIGAKQYFMKADSNQEYLNKTHNDIEKLFNMINEYNYDWEKEYFEIIKFYINNKKSLKDFKDYGRICIEGYIWDNVVKGYPELVKWFKLVSKIDYNWMEQHKESFDLFDHSKIQCMDDFLYGHNGDIIKNIITKRLTKIE